MDLSADSIEDLTAAVVGAYDHSERVGLEYAFARERLYEAMSALRNAGWGPQAIGRLIGWNRQHVADVIGTRRREER